jgi:hypothetical protein
VARLRGILVLLAGATLALAAAAAGCGGGGVSTDEARDALAELPYEIEYEDPGQDGVLTGVARAKNGAAVRFALAVTGTELPKRLVATFGDQPDLVSGSGFTIVTENVFGPGETPDFGNTRTAIAVRLESAICEITDEECFP